MIDTKVPEGDKRNSAIRRIERSLDPSKPLEGEEDMATVWEAQARTSPGKEDYEKRFVEIWRETGCAAEGAPYLVQQLLFSLGMYFEEKSPQLPGLAATFLDEEQCPGAKGLSDADKAGLKAIRDRSAPPVPKP